MSRKVTLIFTPAPYNPDNMESTLAHAKSLVGKTLREAIALFVPAENQGLVMEEAVKYDSGNSTGKFGNAIEAGHFYYRPNSDMEPDLEWAELKTTGLENFKKTDAKRVRNRVSICMINYGKKEEKGIPPVILENFETSHAKKKLESVLLVFYDWVKGVSIMDLKIDLVDLWSPDINELRMIKEDWETIKSLIEKGEAHNLSEGMTNILGASTKGAKGQDRPQANNDSIRAKPRAFALKQSFINHIYNQLKNPMRKPQIHTSIKGIELYRKSNKRFEDFVVGGLNKFAGKTTIQICKELKIVGSFNGKGQHAQRMRRFLNCILTGDAKNSWENIAEFKKTGLSIKTVRRMKSGLPNQHVSFPKFDYNKLIAEEDDWEDSELYGMLTNRFLFIVLKFTGKGSDPIFDKAVFHSLSEADLDDAQKCWKGAIKKCKEKHYKEMPGAKDNRVIHVRYHDSKDKKTGEYRKGYAQQSFWLNKSYLKDVIK